MTAKHRSYQRLKKDAMMKMLYLVFLFFAIGIHMAASAGARHASPAAESLQLSYTDDRHGGLMQQRHGVPPTHAALSWLLSDRRSELHLPTDAKGIVRIGAP